MLQLLALIYILISSMSTVNGYPSSFDNFAAMTLLVNIFDTLRSFGLQAANSVVGKGMATTPLATSSIVSKGMATTSLAVPVDFVKVQPLQTRKHGAAVRKTRAGKHFGPEIVQAPTGQYNCTVM